MRQEDRNNQAAERRQTRVEVRTEPRTRRANEALREAALSPLEERALRMRFGVALGPDDALDELTGLSERGARQLAALEAWSEDTKTPVLVLALPDHTQAAPERCTEFISEKDCGDQSKAYIRLTTALQQTQLRWVDGQQIYASTGRPHFMGADRDTGHPTREGHAVIAAGIATIVRETIQ